MQEENKEDVKRRSRRCKIILSTFILLYVFFRSLHKSFKFIEKPKQTTLNKEEEDEGGEVYVCIDSNRMLSLNGVQGHLNRQVCISLVMKLIL